MSEPTRDELTATRFWAKVDRSGHCWIWTGRIINTGYSHFTRTLEGRQRHILAHRWAYEQAFGSIPTGLVIDHLCRTRACVRPDHLEVVTFTENIRRAPLGKRAAPQRSDTCKKGHPWEAGSHRVSREGWRSCLICRREHDRAKATPEAKAARNAHRRDLYARGLPR